MMSTSIEYFLKFLKTINFAVSKTNRMDDALKISVLHRRLKQYGCLENRWSVLYLLYSLSNSKDSKVTFGIVMRNLFVKLLFKILFW